MEKAKNSEWEDPVDKVVNWRFERLVEAGYTVDMAEELAQNRRLDLHDLIRKAEEYGPQVAFYRFF